MDDAIKTLEEKYNTTVTEYTICAKRGEDGEFYHNWYLGSDLSDVDVKEVANTLDESLKSANKNYKVARSKALKGVVVSIVPADYFHEWNAKNKKKGGQVKMERVMKEEKFKEFEAYMNELSNS